MRRRTIPLTFLMMFAAACGADNTDGITFTTIGQPALFDAKLDDGRWQAYTPKHVVEDNATYSVPTFVSTIDAMFVCEKADGSFSATEIRTAEANDLQTACDVTVQREQLVVTIHGVMPQASVDVYDFTDFINQADAQFSIQAVTRNYREQHGDDFAFDEDVPGWRWAITADNRRCSAAVNRTIDANSFAQTSFN